MPPFLTVKGLDTLEDEVDKPLDAAPVVGIHILCLTPSDDTADSHGTMPHESSKPSERGALHLIVRQTVALEVEALNLLIELGVL